MTPDVAAIAASVARPWTGTEWGYGKFVTSEKIGGAPLLDLAGYAVEMGSGAYPQEMLVLMRNRWANNVKQVSVQGQVDIKITAWCWEDILLDAERPIRSGELGSHAQRWRYRSREGEGFRYAQGPGTKAESFVLQGDLTVYGNVFQFKVAKIGTYTVRLEAWPEGRQDANPKDNTTTVTFEVKPLPEVPRDSKIHVEIISN